MDVPVQYFQSIVAIELAVAGALLFQIRFFELRPRADEADQDAPHPWIRVLIAVIIGATIFGALHAMIHPGGRLEAIAVTMGLGVSVLPILIRALPPLTAGKQASGARRTSDVLATVVGLVLYGIAVAALILLLSG
jgi:ribose/xylose/arabinose/galactoside ABC-type transport system permease subunit